MRWGTPAGALEAQIKSTRQAILEFSRDLEGIREKVQHLMIESQVLTDRLSAKNEELKNAKNLLDLKEQTLKARERHLSLLEMNRPEREH